MEKKTYYILLRDLEDPSSQSSAGMLWGMLSNYVYGTQTPLALKGELFESLPAADITTAGVECYLFKKLKLFFASIEFQKDQNNSPVLLFKTLFWH